MRIAHRRGRTDEVAQPYDHLGHTARIEHCAGPSGAPTTRNVSQGATVYDHRSTQRYYDYSFKAFNTIQHKTMLKSDWCSEFTKASQAPLRQSAEEQSGGGALKRTPERLHILGGPHCVGVKHVASLDYHSRQHTVAHFWRRNLFYIYRIAVCTS